MEVKLGNQPVVFAVVKISSMLATLLWEGYCQMTNRFVEMLRTGVHWGQTIILALRRLKQEDCEFEASLDYVARCCLERSHIYEIHICHRK
jgi:hypothetical protein